MEEAELAPPLPDDALAAVLRRLPPCSIAASRCVCKAWRDVVDAHGLLLPRAVRGIYLNFINYRCPRFIARPSSERPGTHGNLGFLPRYSRSLGSILDHCNGLLLYDGGFMREFYVVNPATRRWKCLPPRMGLLDYVAYLVFDPAVSPHYEVVLMPRVPEKPVPIAEKYAPPPSPVNLARLFSLLDDELDVEDTDEEDSREEPVGWPPHSRSIEEGFFSACRFMPASSEPEDPYVSMEWPPSPYTFHVFSSCTGCWEKRSFVREGEAVGTVEDVRLDSWPAHWGPRRRYGVYWRGALYVHCRGAFVMRLSLTNSTYQVIKTPTNGEESHHTRFYLGRSEKGVYLAAVQNYSQLQIWILDESCGQVEWVSRHHNDLDPYVSRAAVDSDYHERIDGPWILEDEDSEYTHIDFLGFHPYKEIIFLMASFIGIAYHLNTSRVQYLGKLRPDDYDYTQAAGVYESFLYTPCMTGDLPETKHENHSGDSKSCQS
ncbi:hypothetical protein EJB05_07104, partial [Eragrostis curvula]